jgi:lipopolysaccharide transport system permease protein/teichoic acid transport system permease protein
MTFFESFLRDSFKNRLLLWRLAVRQFLSGTFGSTFGITWVLLEPLVYIGVLYVFFTKAARFTPSGTAPYLPWLMCAMSLWQFFSSAINSGLGTFRSHSYFLKKWNFNLSILPIVPLVSNLFLHFIFLGILILVFFATRVQPTLYWLQSLYYLFSLCVFLTGLTWILGSFALFFQDLKSIVSICLQLGFWISPIFWDVQNDPVGMGRVLELNPLSYVMQGYRDSFLYSVGAWTHPRETLIFWGTTAAIWIAGAICYRKLRPSFGDVLT